MRAMHVFLLLVSSLALLGPALADAPATPPISAARVTILSTMLAEAYQPEATLEGEWGFAALVEANGRRLLFDTGAQPETVLRNAAALGIDLSSITDVVLSHFHWDHTGGLVTLRRELSKKNPTALSRAHVARGFFWPRKMVNGKPYGKIGEVRSTYEAAGGQFVEHDGPGEVLPGVWVTGPVPRVHPEKNYAPDVVVTTPDGKTLPDDVPDDSSLVLDTTDGLVVVIGCGHAGIVNTLEAARSRVRKGKVTTVVGGLHLFSADDATLDWTGAQLKRFGVANLVGAHCTGIEAVYRLRQAAGLDRKHCVVGSIGASYDLAKGIDPRRLAR